MVVRVFWGIFQEFVAGCELSVWKYVFWPKNAVLGDISKQVIA